jgi:hypothetical protein
MDKTNVIDADEKLPATAPEPVDLKRNADAELRLDGEDDALYNDGLDIETDAGGLAGTRGNTPGIAKP